MAKDLAGEAAGRVAHLSFVGSVADAVPEVLENDANREGVEVATLNRLSLHTPAEGSEPAGSVIEATGFFVPPGRAEALARSHRQQHADGRVAEVRGIRRSGAGVHDVRAGDDPAPTIDEGLPDTIGSLTGGRSDAGEEQAALDLAEKPLANEGLAEVQQERVVDLAGAGGQPRIARGEDLRDLGDIGGLEISRGGERDAVPVCALEEPRPRAQGVRAFCGVYG